MFLDMKISRSISRPLGLLGLTTALMGMAISASAQTTTATQDEEIEEVIVTGTMLRGVAPVGSPITTVTREQIESTNAQTTQDIMRMIPNVSNSAAVTQGYLVGSSYFAPTIRSLGSSASSSTLVLIDSHRIPLGNTSHPLPDPSIVPNIAIERVEVIPDGSSSIYGSDAVAGVVNFITRDAYDGFMMTGQGGFGDDYDTQNLGLLWGTGWAEGSAMVAYGYTYKSALARASRDILDRDKRPRGGTNFLNRVCEPATIQPAGSSSVYGSVNDAVPLADPNICQETVSDHIPDESRHNVMVKLQQDLAPNLAASADFLYAWRENVGRESRGSIQGVAYATGPQANPFYENPLGVVADSQTLRLLGDELFGPGRENTLVGEAYYTTGELQWSINNRFTLTGFGMVGRTETKSTTLGQICTSCAYLALNGTTNGAGNLNSPSIPGTTITPTNLPLTVDNALDLWRPAATNRTNPAVLDAIASQFSEGRVNQSIQQYRLILDGDLMELPGGQVRGALGAELVKYTVTPQQTSSNNIGIPESTTAFIEYIEQDVESIFAELLVPIVGPQQGLSFMNALDLSLSVRRDDYPLFGSTTNPKVGFDWEIIEGLKFRGSFSESFVAPPMSTTANRYTFSQHGNVGGTVNIPVANFPEAALLPGCENVDQCSVGSSTPRPGMFRLTSDPGLQPQTGESWSVGFDFAPRTVDGQLSVTYFENEYRGGVTAANFNMIVNTPGLEQLLEIYPNGATQAEINANAAGTRLSSELDPNNIFFFFNRDMANVVNLDIAGWDIQGRYGFETENLGRFTIGGSVMYVDKFDQFFGQGGETFSVLGTQGFNQTFSSVEMQARADFTWESGDFRLTTMAYYTPSHLNWSSTSQEPIGLTPRGNPDGTGGDKVDSFVTFDLNLTYSLSNLNAFDGSLGDTVVYLDLNNVFDEDPPFYNSPDGYGPYNANPIGRVISAGIRIRL